MAGPGYFGPPLTNHQHSTQAGDGSQLVNLSVSGTVNTTGTPAAAGDLVPQNIAIMMALLWGRR